MSTEKSIFLEGLSINDSFKSFFEQSEVIDELKKIEKEIAGQAFTPKANVALRFASTNLHAIKATVFGKDPYPQKNGNGEFVATGRAFEVNGVTSWNSKAINSSLKNVIKLMHKTYMNLEVGAPIKKVRQSIAQEEFLLPTPDKAFTHWEEQGVLFLNTGFTCKVGGRLEAGSHLKLWKRFFNLLLEYMSKENPSILYFLWGDAQKYGKTLRGLGVMDNNLYESKHPCTNGDSGGYKKNTSFLMNPCFHDSKDAIQWIPAKE